MTRFPRPASCVLWCAVHSRYATWRLLLCTLWPAEWVLRSTRLVLPQFCVVMLSVIYGEGPGPGIACKDFEDRMCAALANGLADNWSQVGREAGFPSRSDPCSVLAVTLL